MKTVLIMRHAHAVADNPAFIDEERPLTEAGSQLVHKTVPAIREWPVQTILTSSATRTQQTATLVQSAFPDITEIDVRQELYLASVEQYVHCMQNLSNQIQCAMIVGHNPSVASLLANWSGEHLSVSPGTIAAFEFSTDDWSTLRLVNKKRPVLAAYISHGERIR